jgi:hypothetical protein
MEEPSMPERSPTDHFFNFSYHSQVEQALRNYGDVLEDMVPIYWSELSLSISPETDVWGLLAQSLFDKSSPFASPHFWQVATCAEAMAYILRELRSALLLDSLLSTDLLNEAEAACSDRKAEEKLLSFVQFWLQAEDAERKTLEVIWLLMVHFFAALALKDKATRKLMGVKRGIFG